jgi:hypothetical protein
MRYIWRSHSDSSMSRFFGRGAVYCFAVSCHTTRASSLCALLYNNRQRVFQILRLNTVWALLRTLVSSRRRARHHHLHLWRYIWHMAFDLHGECMLTMRTERGVGLRPPEKGTAIAVLTLLSEWEAEPGVGGRSYMGQRPSTHRRLWWDMWDMYWQVV